MVSQKKYLTLQQAGTRMRVSRARIYQLIDEGRMKSISVYGRRLVERAEVEDWVTAQAKTTDRRRLRHLA